MGGRRRLRIVAGAVFAALAMLLSGHAATAADKPLRGVALVIGQSDYASLPKLDNPQRDARAIDTLLDSLGFDVSRVLDGDGAKLKDRIDRFVDDAADADVALVYYSGHGIEAGGEDYLVPVDADLSTPQRAGQTLLPVSDLLARLAKTVPITIVLLDACRTGAFPDGTMIQPPGALQPVPAQTTGLGVLRGPAAVGKSLAPANPGLGIVIGFAASPGEPALDGAPGDANSPYAAALLKHLGADDYSFGDVMTMVSEEVYLKTGSRQLPWVNSSLRRVLTFGQPPASGDADQAAIQDGRRKLLLSIADTPPATQKYIESLAGEEKVPLDALYGMLEVLGIKATDDNGDLQQQLQKGAEKLREQMASPLRPVSSDPDLQRFGKLADEAESEGAMALALKYRDQASARADTLLSEKLAEARQIKTDILDLASTYAIGALTASLNFDHRHAAELYGKAFEATKDLDASVALTYKIDEGDALTDQGYYVADNGALQDALAVYSDALALAPQQSDASNWGRIRDRMGQAQALLGARLGDASILNRAVAAFGDALTVETRSALPDRWAAAENNLGNALFDVGSLTDDQQTLGQSIAAFDAALEVYTRDSSPVRWATAESNRGGAQIELAHAIYAATDDAQTAAIEAGNNDADNLPEVVAARDKSVGILSEVVTTLQGAVVALPRELNPLEWALIEHTLAGALSERAKLTSSAEDLKSAADAYRGVLEVHDRDKTPVQWSISAGNLAATLRNYAGLIKDPAPLLEATDLLQQSLTLTPQAQSPGEWAELETKLGNVWADRVDYDHDPASVDKAVAAYKAAEAVLTPASDVAAWGRLELYMVSTLLKTAVPSHDLPRLQQALDTATEAQATLAAHGAPDASVFAQMIPTLSQFIGSLGPKPLAPSP